MTKDCLDDHDFDHECFEDDGKRSVQRGLMRIVHKYTSVLFGQLSEYEIYPGQVPVIMIVEKNDGMSQSEIGKRLHIKPPTVAVSMKRMEKKGLIERRPDSKDQRVTRVYATRKLHEVYERINELVKEDESRMLEGFSTQEVDELNDLLTRLVANLDTIQAPKLGKIFREESEE